MHGLLMLPGAVQAALPADTIMRLLLPAVATGRLLPAAAAVTHTPVCPLPAAAAVIIGRLLLPAADIILQAALPAAGSKDRIDHNL